MFYVHVEVFRLKQRSRLFKNREQLARTQAVFGIVGKPCLQPTDSLSAIGATTIDEPFIDPGYFCDMSVRRNLAASRQNEADIFLGILGEIFFQFGELHSVIARTLELVFEYVKAYMFRMRDLATFHAALADESRLRLLHLMANGEICVCYLQGVLQTNQPKISRHLAYLKKAGLVEARREGKWMYYRLKKLDSGLAAVLSESLNHLRKLPAVQKDIQRLKQISCCPSRFGFGSAPKK